MRRRSHSRSRILDGDTALPSELDAERALMRLHGGAEFGVVVDVETGRVAQAERGRRAGIGAELAFANALHRNALRAQADEDRTEILREIVDEFAVGRQVQNLPVEIQ